MSPVTITVPPSALHSLLGSYLNESNQTILFGFLLSFTFWNILNIIAMNLPIPDKHLSRADKIDLRNRLVSIIHGTLLLFLSGYNTYFAHSQCGEHNTQLEEYLLIISNGYFAYDLAAMAYLRILDRSMLIHHNICIIGMSFGLATGHGADILIGALFLTEISNPAMHVRVILRHLNLRYTRAYETTELTYMRNIT